MISGPSQSLSSCLRHGQEESAVSEYLLVDRLSSPGVNFQKIVLIFQPERVGSGPSVRAARPSSVTCFHTLSLVDFGFRSERRFTSAIKGACVDRIAPTESSRKDKE